MTIVERIMFAFSVMARWETLVSLAAFIIVWILFRNIADPWAKEGRVRKKISFKRSPAPKPLPETDQDIGEIDEDDELPD
jgi:hypothetical protein